MPKASRSYIQEKFSRALSGMRETPSAEALANAWIGLTALDADDFSGDHRARFDALDKKITAVAAERPGEGSVHASARSMTPAERRAFAAELRALAAAYGA